MRNLLQEYFYYTRIERNGLSFLGSLTLFFFIMPFVWAYWLSDPQVDFSLLQSDLAAFQPQFQQKTTTNKATLAYDSSSPIKVSKLFKFDPNKADKTTLIKLGLSNKTATNIINYRTKVKRFEVVNDLKNVYTLKSTDFERLKNYVVIANLPKTKASPKKDRSTAEIKPIEEKILQPFPFDPNTITTFDLKRLGLPDRVIKTMINFRNKGGTFRKPEDLSRIYGLSTTVFQQLKPYIQLTTTTIASQPAFTHNPTVVPFSYSSSKNITIDINQATVEQWQELRGVGPYFAKRIVLFRDKLGGFSSIEQVGTTYYLPDSTFQSIKASLEFSPIFQKIKINQSEEKVLAEHPYISNKLARAIVNYRTQHGFFKNIMAFQKMKILKQKDVKLLTPYLDFGG